MGLFIYMKLIYAKETGLDTLENFTYELIFSEKPKDAWGNFWDTFHPEPPDKEFIDFIVKIKSESELFEVFNNRGFSMYDAKDGVIALLYEIDEDIDENVGRMIFKYGDDISKITATLSQLNIKYLSEKIK